VDNGAMSVTHSELDGFHRFAQDKLQSGGAESLEELCDLWRIEHPSADEEAEIHSAIRQGLADIEAGNFRPAEEVMAELRKKHGLSVE
jgi:hypothetical protein